MPYFLRALTKLLLSFNISNNWKSIMLSSASNFIEALIKWVIKTFGHDAAAIILIVVILNFAAAMIFGIRKYMRKMKKDH